MPLLAGWIAFHGIVRATMDVDLQNPSRVVDILIKYDLDDFDVIRVSWSGHRIPVVSLEGLLKMKEGTGRAQDQADTEKIREKLKQQPKSKGKTKIVSKRRSK